MPNDAIISDMGASPKKLGKMVRQKPYVVAIVVLAVLAVVGIGFGVIGIVLHAEAQSQIAELESRDSNIESDSTEILETDTGDDAVLPDLSLGSDKFLGDGAYVFSLEDSMSGAILLRLSQAAKGTAMNCDTGEERMDDAATLELAVNWDEISDWYDLGRVKTGVLALENVTLTGINPEDVVDVKVGQFGQMVGREVLLFLMKDGSIEYIPMAQAAREGDFHSYGKIKGVDDIVAIKHTSISGGCSGGWTMIAQKANGEFYDLSSVLEAQGVFGN